MTSALAVEANMRLLTHLTLNPRGLEGVYPRVARFVGLLVTGLSRMPVSQVPIPSSANSEGFQRGFLGTDLSLSWGEDLYSSQGLSLGAQRAAAAGGGTGGACAGRREQHWGRLCLGPLSLGRAWGGSFLPRGARSPRSFLSFTNRHSLDDLGEAAGGTIGVRAGVPLPADA